ncbi:unnamed protein product [Brassicogethes aeneus]|uniref:Carboxylesterase type B domain-containing protein n=1 Tax=Brassicogethes aeneus TaxID=1431903 RepID=A0A9P0FDE4_BRAAE|nr:unnamed protein product [Brassicogethes aeneus]
MLVRYFVLLFIFKFSEADERSHRVRRIVGGIPADKPPEDDPVVFTRFAEKSAKIIGTRSSQQYVFRGIRYAHPPIGSNRFVRPREKFLEGEINATQLPPPCLQPMPGQNKVVGSEDCLFLNIFTPTLPTGTEGLPVVVWIHGGGFRYGSASQYGVNHLVGKQLVVVTIQYRLGSLGFLSSGSQDLPGNAALWDMALATQWVRNYIGFFGGNPHRIVVMGHGTGASSTLLVTLSNIAKGISGVVAMSGTAVSHWATDNTPRNTALEVATHNGCPTASTLIMIKCLQNTPPESIIQGDSMIEFQRLRNQGFVSGLNGQLSAAPVREGYHDGRSLPPLVEDDPINDLKSQKNPDIPLLTGITKHETSRAVHGQYKDEVLEKLKTIPNFLDKVLIKNLQGFLVRGSNKNQTGTSKNNLFGILGGVGDSLLNFRNYIQVKKNDLKEGLSKISEATSDALFNVPAFLTAGLWSQKGSPTYLYSFEHAGKMKKGYSFLKGMPIVGNGTMTDDNETIGHGDDLNYLFEANDIFGNPIENNEIMNEDDRKVREVFTQMIADFARTGKPIINNKEAPPFSATKNNFIQIKPKPQLSDSFRFCQMALWCNIAERLKSSSCQFLNGLDTTVKGIQEGFFDTINTTGSKLGLEGAANISQQYNILDPKNKVNQNINIFNPNHKNTSTAQQAANISQQYNIFDPKNKVNENINIFNPNHNKNKNANNPQKQFLDSVNIFRTRNQRANPKSEKKLMVLFK